MSGCCYGEISGRQYADGNRRVDNSVSEIGLGTSQAAMYSTMREVYIHALCIPCTHGYLSANIDTQGGFEQNLLLSVGVYGSARSPLYIHCRGFL